MAVMRKYEQILFVGVFVNAAVEEINSVMQTCGLDLAQLHGDESAEMLSAFKGKAFKAIRLSTDSKTDSRRVTDFAESCREMVPVLLVDAAVKDLYGGSGVIADWNGAAELAKKYPLLLAGGLTPENVAEAVRQVRPWGVDVASGVESAPGEKDAGRISAFVKAVRFAESGGE
jgi:phosphoribosylanthranilate isomerase